MPSTGASGSTSSAFRSATTRPAKPGRRRDGRLPRSHKLLIKPSAEAVTRHHQALRAVVRGHKAASQTALLMALNPIIRGWAAYYRTVVAKAIFASCDYHPLRTLRHWAGRRHGQKSWKWVFNKYWQRGDSGRLEFATSAGLRLVHHADTPIQRYVKVRGTASPYNGDLVYWAQRLRQYPLTVGRLAILLKRQHGRCAWCGSLFLDRAEIGVDHVRPRVFNGQN